MRRRQALRAIPGIGAALGFAPWSKAKAVRKVVAGVEARVVFLDHFLVEWANSIRAGLKLKGGERKALLKSIGERWLPRSIVHRPKVGFTVPLGQWLRPGGPLSAYVDRLRERDSFVRSIVEARYVDRLLREHDAGAIDHGDIIWSLAALETWSGIFLGPQLHRFDLPGRATGRRATANPVNTAP